MSGCAEGENDFQGRFYVGFRVFQDCLIESTLNRSDFHIIHILLSKTSELNDRDFIIRNLYKYCY